MTDTLTQRVAEAIWKTHDKCHARALYNYKEVALEQAQAAIEASGAQPIAEGYAVTSADIGTIFCIGYESANQVADLLKKSSKWPDSVLIKECLIHKDGNRWCSDLLEIKDIGAQHLQGVVEALKRISTHQHINADGSINAGVAYSAHIAKEALAALPPELRGKK